MGRPLCKFVDSPMFFTFSGQVPCGASQVLVDILGACGDRYHPRRMSFHNTYKHSKNAKGVEVAF